LLLCEYIIGSNDDKNTDDGNGYVEDDDSKSDASKAMVMLKMMTVKVMRVRQWLC
jgi:hypothetical protein